MIDSFFSSKVGIRYAVARRGNFSGRWVLSTRSVEQRLCGAAAVLQRRKRGKAEQAAREKDRGEKAAGGRKAAGSKRRREHADVAAAEAEAPTGRSCSERLAWV